MSKVIICITQSLWVGPKRIRHHLMEEFANRGYEVYFIEAYYSVIKLIKKPYLIFQVIKNLFKIRTAKKVFLLQVPPFLPFGEWFKFINDINWSIARFWTKYILKQKLINKEIFLFVFAPYAYKFINYFSEKLSIYICNDPFTTIFKYKSAYNNLNRMECLLTRKVNLVFAVSDNLVNERQKCNKNTYLLDHAVDYDLFSKAVTSNIDIPEDIKHIKKPIIGHIGPLNHRIDVDLLQELFYLYPNYNFLFIGPIIEIDNKLKKKIHNIFNLPNVFFLGHKEDFLLPKYLKFIDVCIIPYVKNEASSYFKMPAKFYQYLAAGKPVVSTVGSINVDDSLLKLASNSIDMVNKINKALSETTPDFQKKRMDFAFNFTFKKRVDEIEKRIEEYLKKRN